jgi:hypothetical protein
MVACGDDISPGIDRIVEDFLGNAKAARSVFAIDDGKVELQIGYQTRQLLVDRCPAGTAHHVTKKK